MYLKNIREHINGRVRYNPVNMLKTVLFVFMISGYCSLRELEDNYKVIDNLESIHGALLRMNRSIQAEGTFGIMKNVRWYKRIVRRGIESVKLPRSFTDSIGHNLYKYHNKKS